VSKGSWEILRPTMRKSGSEIWIIVNPELEDDYTYPEFIVRPPEGAVCIEVNWKDNPHLSDEALAEKDDLARKDPDAYLNIWEGKCRHALDGAIYAKELRDADGEARITRVPYNHGHPVHTGWDLGHSDHTSIWFIQRIGYEHHIIDFYQNNAEKVGHYLEILQQRKYLYGNIYLPHDANSELLAGNSIKKQVELEYPGKVIVVPRTDSIVNDINAVRTMFPNFYFDKERCAEGLHCLRHYRYGVDDTTGRRSRFPLHDFASDAADALRTFAVGFKPSSRKAKPQRQGLGGAALSWMGL
jgi:phage terminase large subunit